MLLCVVKFAQSLSGDTGCGGSRPGVEVRAFNAQLTPDLRLVPYQDLPPAAGAYTLPTNVVASTCLGFGDESKLDPGKCRILTCKRHDACNLGETRGATLYGWSVVIPGSARKCICNAHNALCYRHGTTVGEELADINAYYPAVAKFLASVVAEFDLSPYLDREAWISRFQHGKRIAIDHSCMHDVIMAAKVKAMVKWEVMHKFFTKARLIQFYINLATQAAFGPEFVAISKAISSAFDGERELFPGVTAQFSMGLSSAGIAAWGARVLREGYTHFYERDGKSWDATMRANHSRFKERLFALFDPALAAFVHDCCRVKGLIVGKDGILRYIMNWTVKSGHNDTSSGNSLINAIIAAIAAHVCGLKVKILVMGDDLIMAVSGDFDVKAVAAVEAKYGIVPEARKFDNIFDCSYVSGIFIPNGKEIGFVPIPGRLIMRLWWSIANPGKYIQAYRNGVVAGLLPTCQALPIVRVFLMKFANEGTVGRSDKGYLYRGVALEFDEEIYLWMQGRYGLSRSDIEACEAWLEQLPAEPLLLVHPVLERIVEVDIVDIDARTTSLYF